jgi:hypothetical protein
MVCSKSIESKNRQVNESYYTEGKVRAGVGKERTMKGQ